jgi:hypothetical protein
MPPHADVRAIRRHAQEHIENGAVVESYGADPQVVVDMLNAALATELVCVMRYKRHYYMAHSRVEAHVADEFLKHAEEELVHADALARRITQLNGAPNFDPETLLSRAHSQYGPGGTLGENDIAVIILAEPATTRPVLLRQSPVTDADLGKELLSVGFGITETGRGDGVKRSAALLLSDYDEFFLLSENESNENNANICSGDSGGPQFSWVEDHWEQWAVHSWGDQNCRQVSGSTRVDVVNEWILDQIEAVHGTRDQCEASGWYGDGACDPWCPVEDVDCLPPEEPEEDAVDGEGDSKGSGGCAAAPSPLRLGWALLPLALLLRGRRRS